MMFHHKQAEHVTVGLFKDHEGQPLVTVDGINAGTVDFLEEMIRNFRRQQAEALADPNQVKAPFVISDGVLYADEVRVKNLRALSVFLGNVQISEAFIGPGR
ncbi:hypothetical protein [Agrobacterium radiobacter]|uniref:hypothetical protein n=1 Tax=Agrobacterium radiobacter TaxID=362 RepID=UPI003CF9938D